MDEELDQSFGEQSKNEHFSMVEEAT